MRLRRVSLIITLALGLLAPPLPADAQPPAKIPRVGWLGIGVTGAANPFYEAFLQGLRDHGYVPGQNLILDVRLAEGRLDALPALAAELVGLKVDVLVAPTWPALQAAKRATSTIPTVMISVHDPVGAGLVASLARPGGNLTGLSCFAPQLGGKSLEVLKEAVPGVTRVAVLSHPYTQSVLQELQSAAGALRFELIPVAVGEPAELDRAFATMSQQRAQAVYVESGGFFAQRRRLADLAVKGRLASLYEYREFVEAGGLLSYGPSYTHAFRRAAAFVDKVLKGAKPADLPVERATRFELVINLKTAKALGLKIPQSILIRADQVIQ